MSQQLDASNQGSVAASKPAAQTTEHKFGKINTIGGIVAGLGALAILTGEIAEKSQFVGYGCLAVLVGMTFLLTIKEWASRIVLSIAASGLVCLAVILPFEWGKGEKKPSVARQQTSSSSQPAHVPPVAQPVHGNEMMSLGTGADLDPVLQRGCSTMLPVGDEQGQGGQGELPRGNYKKLGCRDHAGITVEWTMRIDDDHAGEVYILTVTVPTQRLFHNGLQYVDILSPPADRKAWPKAKNQIESDGMAKIESGDLRLSAMPVQAGSKSGQLVMMLTKPGVVH